MWGGIKNTINESEGNSGVELNLLFMSRLQKYLDNPLLIGYALLMHYGRWIPDKMYLRILYRFYMGKELDLENPRTFSEKLQWLKLHNRKSQYSCMVDKYAVKDYVASIIGKEYIIPTLGVWDKPRDIEWDKLPSRFVLKTTHGGGGGGVVICKDKSSFDIKVAKKKLNKSLRQDIYKRLREWPYKDVPKRIIAEEYIENITDTDLKDYKLFCFNGTFHFCQVIGGRTKRMTVDFFDKGWNHLSFHEPKIYPFADEEPQPPLNYQKMIELAEKLSEGQSFLRVDFYEVDGHVKFGELTFYPTSGFGGFEPEEWDLRLGELIKLDGKN